MPTNANAVAETPPSDLVGCAEQVPLLGVTREFDFGQFIELFDNTPDIRFPNTPILSRIVMQPGSTLAAGRAGETGPPSSTLVQRQLAGVRTNSLRASMLASPILTPNTLSERPPAKDPEVRLFDLTEQGPGAKLAPATVIVDEPSVFFESAQVTVDDVAYRVLLDDRTIDEMSMGMAYHAVGTAIDDNTLRRPLDIALKSSSVALSQDDLAKVLAGGTVTANGGARPVLTGAAIRSLLAGTTVMTHTVDDAGLKRPVTLVPPAISQAPADAKFQAFDLPSLFAAPYVLAKDGGVLPIDLTDTAAVKELTTNGLATFRVGTRQPNTLADDRQQVEIRVAQGEDTDGFAEYVAAAPRLYEAYGGVIPAKPDAMDWDEVIDRGSTADPPTHFVMPVIGQQRNYTDIGPPRGWQTLWPPLRGGGGLGSTAPPESPPSSKPPMTDQVQPSLPSGGGLTVAVFVPWRQTWTLKGFSRGNLLSTIALAPQEEMTMQVSSWERRSRTLEQSSETEVSQQTDTSDTTRDTEDVFREMLSKRDFAWQLNGSLDASYSPGVASIRVHADGGVSDTTSIQQTARNSSQSLRESTVKASSRVSSRRVTRVTQSVESGKEERVTRNIRNPNQCHTLSLDFFETLAHYEISLKFQAQRLRLVVMLPNPIKIKVDPDLTDLIRRNETALRNALLEPALVDAFEACRYQAAYQRAQKLTAAQKQLSDTAQELPAQRNTPPATPGDPAAPQRAELERLVAAFLAAAAAIRGDSGIDEALAAIGARQPVSQPNKRRGQRWLFINFANHVFPQLLSTLDALAAQPPAPLDAAQRLLAVLPRPDSPTQLSSLNQLSDSEKESAGLASRLKLENVQHERLFMKMDWDWAWWTGRLHEESLYTCDDNGLAGLADQLQRAWSAWESKQAQGTAMKDQEVAKVEAEGRQDQVTIDDKLSMAFPLGELARASERVDTLVAHLGDHLDYYSYVLFQALPPSEQALRIVDASQGRLQVGLFEPRVVAMNGSKLVVPLTPLAGSQSLIDFVDNLRTKLSESFAESEATPDTTVLPTPGISISSRLGNCSGCEDYIEQARGHELRRLAAVASQAESEAERRRKRLAAGELGEFEERRPDLKLALESTTKAPAGGR